MRYTWSKRARLWTAVSLVLAALLIASPAAAAGREGEAVGVPKNRTPKIPGRGTGRTGKGPNDTWYLAEGSTAWGFRTMIQIENPSGEATGRVTFMLSDGSSQTTDVTLYGGSTVYLNPEDYVGARDFSTMVQCLQGYEIAVSRVMLFGTEYDTCMHSSIGTTELATAWALAEGCTGGSFETWVLVQNPAAGTAHVNLAYQTPQGAYAGPDVFIPGNSRQTFNVADTLPGEWSVSTMVTSDVNVIAERAMYWDGRRGGHESIGTNYSGTYWYLPEGSTGGDFETWVLVQNPTGGYADIDIDFQTDSGMVSGPSFILDPLSRRTINVADYVPGTWSVSTTVRSDASVVAERAMYGNGRQWGHDSVGMLDAHAVIYLPFAQCGPDTTLSWWEWETWTLIQNPSSAPVSCRIWYITQPGASQNYYSDVTVDAFSRQSFNMADTMPEGSWAAGVLVEAQAGRTILAEGATYVGTGGMRYAGCDSIGGFSD